MYRRFLVRKYLVSRFVAYAALLIVAASVALLIVIVSVMEGFRSELLSRIRGTTSDIKVESKRYIGLESPGEVAKIVEQVPGVAAAASFIETAAICRTSPDQPEGLDRGGDTYLLRGVDIGLESKVGQLEEYVRAVHLEGLPTTLEELFSREWREEGLWKLRGLPWPTHARLLHYIFLTSSPGRRLEKVEKEERLWSLFRRGFSRSEGEPSPRGSLPAAYAEEPGKLPPPILVGKEVFNRQYIYPGDILRLVAYSPTSQAPSTRDFTVVGYFKTGIYEMDAQGIIMSREVARDFLGLEGPGGVELSSGVRVAVQPGLQSPEALERVRSDVEAAIARAEVPFVRVITWRDEKASLINAVKVEKFLMFIILGVIILFAGLMMFIILTVISVEKTRDVGVLQSLGATAGGIASIFLRMGVILCVSGTLLGVVYGYSFAANVDSIQRWLHLLLGFVVFPQNIYYLDGIPVSFQLSDILTIVLPTIALSILAAYLPARRMAENDPVVGLRYQ